MNRVAIMGLGLMGGSLGLALKKHGFSGRVVAYARRGVTRDAALRDGVVDEVFAQPGDAVADADLVIFCVPIRTIPEMVAVCAERCAPGCILTDVGSTKEELSKRVPELLRGMPAVFVGSHPIAGSEQQGLDAARPDLYEGAVVVVTPASEEEAAPAGRLKAFWESLGAQVSLMSPAEHDRILARTSHLPHIVAALLASAVARPEGFAGIGPYCGTGFRDTTRVADGSPDVWRDIAQTNQESLLHELERFKGQLEDVLGHLAGGNHEQVEAFLEASRTRRRLLLDEETAEAGGPAT